MKKAIVCIAIAASAIWVATPQMTQAAETVPWFSTFETNTVDIPITNNSEFGSWTGTDDMIATVTNIGSYFSKIQSPMVTYPITNDTHDKVVVFNGAGLTNEVVGGASVNTWVDMMIQPVQMDQPMVSTTISNSQMSMFVNTSGYVCVYHAILTNTTSDNIAARDGCQWTELTDFGPIGTDKWIRVTVWTDYSGYSDGYSLFQLTVNNHVFTNALAFVGVTNWPASYLYTNANLNGSWFLCANNRDRIDGVAFSGTGMLDDLVVTNGPVTSQEVAAPLTITATANAGGTVSPLGVITFDAAPGETNFIITANAYFHIADIKTNNTTIGGLSGTETYTNFLMTGITEPGTLDVFFAPDLATPNSTPQWWLAQYTNSQPIEQTALVIGNDDSDVDGDGAKEWQEYVAGTIPTNPASVLKILAGQVANGTGTVVWSSTTYTPDTNAAKYVIQAATNLVEGTWFTLPGSTMDRVEGIMSNSASAGFSPAFFRVSFTNQ